MDQFLDLKKEIEKRQALSAEVNQQKDTQEEVYSQYKDFLNEPIDSMFKAYNFKGRTAVVKVFGYKPKKTKNSVLLMDGSSSSDRHYRTFSVGKVLATGPESEYSPGDIVKLRDWDTATMNNPRYEAWVNNPHNSSNMKKVGQEPPTSINNLMAKFSTRIFSVNPLLVEKPEDDWITFELTDMELGAPIKNPMELIS